MADPAVVDQSTQNPWDKDVEVNATTPWEKDAEIPQGSINLTNESSPTEVKAYLHSTESPYADPKTKDEWINALRSFAVPAVAAGAQMAGVPFPVTTGLLGGGLIDAVMQHVQSQQPTSFTNKMLNIDPNSALGTIANTGELMTFDKLGRFMLGRGIQQPAYNAEMERNYPGSIVNPDLRKLKATYSSYLDPNSWWGKAAAGIEDTLARTSKQKATAESAQIGNKMADREAAQIAGRSAMTVTNPQIHSQLLQQEAISNQKDLINTAKHFATEAKFYEPNYVIDPKTRKPYINPATQQPVPQNPNFDFKKYNDAVQNHEATKKIIGDTFDQPGLANLVRSPNTDAMPAIDALLSDSQQLQRAVNSSNLKLPGGQGVTSPQLKEDLRAYYLNKVVSDGATRDPNTHAITSVDPQRIIDSWNNPKRLASQDILFSKREQQDISELYQNLQRTRNMGQAINPSKIYWGMTGLTLLPTLLPGVDFRVPPATIAGVRLLGGGLGKIMNNPTLAAQMKAAASGKPLGFSDQLIGSAIVKALNGEMLQVQTRDGKTMDGKLENGQFNPQPSQSNR